MWGFMGYLEASRFVYQKPENLVIPKCLVLNIGLKAAVCDVLGIGLGKFKSPGGCGGEGGAQDGGESGGGDTQGGLPGPRSCGRSLTLLVLAQESVLINNLL